MTIARAFAKYMEEVLLLGTFGTDIFIGTVPQDPENPHDKSWWITSGGGSPSTKAETGEKIKPYILSVFYRNTDALDVDTTMQAFEEALNSKHCDQLDGYETLEIEAIGFQSDQDTDSEDRTVGLVEVTITVYQSS